MLQTIELSDEELTSSSPELAVDSLALIRKFLMWQLGASHLKFGLIVPRSDIVKPLLGNHSSDLPRIFLPGYLATGDNHEMIQFCRKGFSVVYSSMSSEREMTDFFRKSHYAVVGDAFSDLTESTIFDGAWNKPQLLSTLKIALDLGGKTLCCFAHDADPIDIVTRC
ncbi:MAG: hypothetical protein MRY59_12060 [Aquisalinus sp.]|nr:hypothetical protein [Aquisalinus sp.]